MNYIKNMLHIYTFKNRKLSNGKFTKKVEFKISTPLSASLCVEEGEIRRRQGAVQSKL